MIDVMNIGALKNRKFLVVLSILIIIVLGYVYFQTQNGNPIVPGQKPDVLVRDKSIIAKVGNLMLLPTNETPQIATVSDKSKLGDQSFFINAENGDKVLIYVINKKAILYRPSINKIIEVGPLAESTPVATPIITQTPTATQTPTIKPLR